jgi:hypothetical protein
MFNPTTVIKLLANVNIDNEYTNTFSFASLSAQTSFFSGKAVRTTNDVTYQRKEKTFRIGVNIESLWNCSYLMFQNTNFGSKWFYGFILDMKYINDAVTEIIFEIDAIQTWYFDISYGNCYIEREHVNNDLIGEHLLEENLNVGEYMNVGNHKVTELEDLAIVWTTTKDISGDNTEGQIVTGTYSGAKYYATSIPDLLNAFLNSMSGSGYADAITSVFMMPSALIDNLDSPVELDMPTGKEINLSYDKNLTTLDDYTPRNNKLFVYPYNFLQISNNHGDVLNLKYEFSDSETMDFFITSDVSPAPTVFLTPMNYRSLLLSWEDSIKLNGYPICNWTTDLYKNWLAQNAVSNAVGVGGSALALAGGIATGNPLAIGSGALGVAGSIGTFYEKSLQPNQLKGSSSGSANVSAGIQNFSFYYKCVRKEFAQMIDNYFDRFGYKVNRLKTPNFLSRENWNYLKCFEVNIFGNIPNNDLKKIHNAFKNGITFWHNDNVGDYNRSNAIGGGGGVG